MDRRSLGRIADIAAGFPGIKLVGRSNVEVTTQSASDADLVTVAGLVIPKASVIVVIFSFHKDAVHASAAQIGLEVNSTTIFATSTATGATAEVQSGTAMFIIGPHDGTYLRSGIGLINSGGATDATNVHFGVSTNIPNAIITSITARGNVVSTSNTLATNFLRVYKFPVR